jgi:TRAP-type uncharacterized transport system fused permease subunit
MQGTQAAMTTQDTTPTPKDAPKPKIDVDEIVAEADSGSRAVHGTGRVHVIAGYRIHLVVLSALHRLRCALLADRGDGHQSDGQQCRGARNIHLAFALILVSFAYPLYKGRA